MHWRSLALALLVLLIVAPTAGAATISPNRFDDTTYPAGYNCPSDCSLRGAVSAAGQGDTVVLQAGAYNLAGSIQIIKFVHVVGVGARSTSITSAGTAGLIYVTSNGIGTFSDLSLTSGEGNSAGALLNLGIATLTNVSVTGSTGNGGGGEVLGGAIHNDGTLTINRSTIAHNYAHAQGSDDASGGAVYNIGNLTVVNSTFSDNYVQTTTGVALGGAVYGTSTSESNFYNVTFGSGNSAFATADANSLGGQAYTESGARWRISNTVFVDSVGGTPSDTCSTYFTGWISMGGNVDPTTIGSCGTNLSLTIDKKSVDALLGPLGNHGGPTDTQLIGAAGPAAGFGNTTMCAETSPAVGGTDQRGGQRITGATCDSGATELNSLANLQLAGALTPASYPKPIAYHLTVTNAGPDPVLGATLAGSTCAIGALAVGASAACDGSFPWNGASPISQTFGVSGAFADPVPADGQLTLSTLAPRFTKVSLSPTSFPPSAKGGATITYASIDAAKIRSLVEKPAVGYIKSGKCTAKSKKVKSGKKCTLWKATGKATTVAVKNPSGKLKLSGRSGKKALAKGKYRVGLTAIASNGIAGSPWYVAFRVK